MGMKCANCGKGVMWGHNVSHSKRRTNRVFRPNLHSAKITIGGQSKRVRLCTKCLRLMKAAMKLQNPPKASKSAEVAAA
jgi:large subunit ribosomal protein L28